MINIWKLMPNANADPFFLDNLPHPQNDSPFEEKRLLTSPMSYQLIHLFSFHRCLFSKEHDVVSSVILLELLSIAKVLSQYGHRTFKEIFTRVRFIPTEVGM